MVDHLCDCNAATPCPLGKVGSEPRCSVRTLRETIAALQDIKAAGLAVVQAVDCNHDTKQPPLRYTVPWLEIVALRKALIAAGSKTEGDYRPREVGPG